MNMTTESIKKERFNQLGLPPMELAESSVNGANHNGLTLRCLLPSLQKIIIMLLIAIFGAGTYILVSKMLTSYDCSGNTIILIKDNNDKLSNSPTLEMIRKLNITEESEITRKKRAIRPVPDTYLDMKEFNSLTFNDDQLQRAREIIMKHDIQCNEQNEQDICKDFVKKLKAISQNNDTINSDILKTNDAKKGDEKQNIATKSIEGDKRGMFQMANAKSVKETKKNIRLNALSSSEPKNCLMSLFRNYRQNILNPSLEYFTSPETHNDEIAPSKNRLHELGEHSSHVRNMDSPGHMHPQDFDILLSFLTPKSESAATQHQDISARKISCPGDTVPCLNGVACVKKKQWCDGYVDCSDVSDEAKCDCKSRVDKSRLCDGYFDCPFGEDEMGCHGCSENTFSCEDKNPHSTCFTKEQRCDKVVECPNHKDELECIMLSPTLLKKPIFAISNTEGFLYRNFKGAWYAVCKNPYMWAHDVCRSEAGLIIRPPYIDLIAIDPMLKMNYVNNDHGGLLETTDGCYNSSAVYVTCPKVLCGTRVKSTSQLLRENIAVENHLFGRNKRFHETNDLHPLMFYDNRWKRNVDNANKTNHENKFDTPKTEDVFGKMRNKRKEGRVVGGQPSQPAAWPWVVALYKNGIFHCGGVIITHSWVICAAHCVAKFWDNYYEVQVGMLRRFSFSPQEQSYRVTHVLVYQHYSQSDMKNDLSLLRVEPAILFSRWVRPICLPSPDVAGQDWLWGPSPGTICTAVGWGATEEHGPDPDHLREVELPIWDKCKHSEDREGREICAGFVEGGKDACQGDSGGPLLCKNPINSQQWYLAGIVSHGDGCGRKDEPGVYTRVSLFVHWIKQHVSSNSLPLIKPIQHCPGFKCESGISKCLPSSRKCDRIVDCLDGEDEVNCEFSKNISTSSDNPDSPKAQIVEDIFIAKEAKPYVYSKKYNKENMDNTSAISVEVSSKSTEETDFVQNSLDTRPTDDSIDFQHASTIEISISRSTEGLNYNNDHITGDPDVETSHEYISDSRETITTITTELNGASLELQSLRDGSAEDTTERKSFKNFEANRDTTTTLEQSTTSFITETEQFDPIDTTTQNIGNNELQPITTHSPLESRQETKFDNKSNELIIELLPKSKLSVIDTIANNTAPIKIENLASNKTKGQGKIIKQLPFADKSLLLNKIEDIVSSEVQPATVRRIPRIPNDFQCRHIYQVIPYKLRCDRKADCEDGTDELECSCSDYLITFDEKLICDGVFDCADGHDELNCFSCGDDQFFCKHSQTCLPLKKVCDSKPQCPLGEDELDCFALTNGKEIYYDLDERPAVNLEGFITKKMFNDWHVACDDKLTPVQQDQAATHICRYLGFGSANTFHVKYINSEEVAIKKRSLTQNRNNKTPVAIKFVYRQVNEVNDTIRHMVIEDPQIIKEECVPNITKTCKSLYVFCDQSLYNNFDVDNLFIRKTENVNKNMLPWAAKVYVDGEYRCIGVLVNLSWVLISDSCLWDSILGHKYITVVLGSHRTLDTTNGMYEQTYQVDSKKYIYHSKVMLLHLKEQAAYTNLVKPMIVSSSFTDIDGNSTCIAVGQDNENMTISIAVEEKNENCNPSNRCFIRKSKENICPPNTSTDRHWAGIISCHSEQGWFPAASFVDMRGECGMGDRIVATYIENIKYEIKHLQNEKHQSSLIEEEYDNSCEGVRCSRGRCISLRNVCDGVSSCEDSGDESEKACEKKRHMCNLDPYINGCECSVSQLKCRNGKCVSKELFRDGNDDCGDRTDEPGQSTCSHYLARVMPSRLCDGILHCHDRSDEDPMFCKCFAKKSFKCGTISNEDYCVAVDVVCDGVQDCPNGEDEKTCVGLVPVKGLPLGTGRVTKRSHGIWHTKCYTKQNHTRAELENICAELGFISGHAKQVHVTEKYMFPNSLVIDKYIEITLNNNTKLKMRNTNNPIADHVFDEHLENCYPLFVECL